MAQITTTTAAGIATAPARTPAYYRVPYAQTVANGVTSNTQMGGVIYSAGVTESKWNLACYDTFAELVAALTALGIPTAKLKDPAPPSGGVSLSSL